MSNTEFVSLDVFYTLTSAALAAVANWFFEQDTCDRVFATPSLFLRGDQRSQFSFFAVSSFGKDFIV